MLARGGWDVLIAARDRQKADAAAVRLRKATGGRLKGVELDVTSEDNWKAAIRESVDKFGALHVLLNSAGIGLSKTVEDITLDEWRKVHAIDLDGVFLGCKYAMPLLAKSKVPSIVNISSASGIVAGANLAAYNASKGAVRMLSKSVALAGARKRPPVRCS